jgi:hypothetical protein
VQVLDLCCNQITRSGALAVARAIGKAKAGGGAPLEVLALDENAISEDGIPQLKQVLKVSAAPLLCARSRCLTCCLTLAGLPLLGMLYW